MIRTIKGTELVTKTLEILENGTLRIIGKGKYIPQYNEIYWFYDGYSEILCFNSMSNERDCYNLSKFLVFRTEKECQEYKNYLNLLNQSTFKPDFKDLKQVKCFICLDHTFGNIVVMDVNENPMQFATDYFCSRTKTIEFIEQVGENKIKRFMFDIWD